MKKLTLMATAFLFVAMYSCSGKSENSMVDSADAEEIELKTPPTNDAGLFPGWVDFENADGRFKVRMPGKPQQSSQKEPTVVGDILVEMFLYEESATQAFIVGYNDYPSGLFDGAGDEVITAMLDGGVEGFTGNMGLDVNEEKEYISLGEAKGVSVKAKSSTSSFHVLYRAYSKGNRLYQVGILRDGSYPPQDKADAFFNSFEITE